ncbi:MAG: putative aldo/keto reductase [Ilumatobacteraceae bacterium]|nr:putative aldo/keto reductase [Ilumatobacteraceae bacterium]
MTIPLRRLGHSDLQVSSIAFGAMMFGNWGNTDVDECQRMVARALDGGITLFDTADMYDDGASETILGQAVRGHREQIVLATKVGNPMGGDMQRAGLSRRWIVQACDDSLRRLQTDHIDLYQMHRPDLSTDIDETLAAFDHLVTAGKVRAIGTSTFSPEQIDHVNQRADELALTRPTSEQPPYSVLARGIESEVLPACRRHDLGVIVWAPLNGGWLTGKYQGTLDDASSRALRQPDHFDHGKQAIRVQKQNMVDRLTALAHDAGLTLKQLALAFVLDVPLITAAIIGPRTLAQLDDLLQTAALPAGLTLPAGVRDAIDQIVSPGTNVNPSDAA